MDKILYKLDGFEGPLDLLLHLISKNKVSIYDIPIAEITDQYLEAIEGIEESDIENASEFKVGDLYYYVANAGNIQKSVWDNDEYALARQQIGNCFKSEEEAEFTVERLKVIKELEDYAKEHNDEIDWDNRSSCKYYICYNPVSYNIHQQFQYQNLQHFLRKYMSRIVLQILLHNDGYHVKY